MIESKSRLSLDDHVMLIRHVLSVWPSLEWRYHGLGMFQAYINQGRSSERRVHIWHPSLVSEAAGNFGSLHDHRFDMTSFVLFGSVPHYQVSPTTAAFNTHTIYEVVNARAVPEGASEDELFREIGPASYIVSENHIPEGCVYTFPKRRFHASTPIKEMAVTLVEKSDQEDTYARILVPKGSGKPTHLTREGGSSVVEESKKFLLALAYANLNSKLSQLSSKLKER